MPIAVVVGGQFGGEGKGAITAFLAWHLHPVLMVKCGGPNASHSFGRDRVLVRRRMLPSGAEFGCPKIAFPAGSLINVRQLEREVQESSYKGKIIVDPRAGVVSEKHISAQKLEKRYDLIGSTLTGTGAASSERCLRCLPLASEEPTLKPFLGSVVSNILEDRSRGLVIIEGAQGFGLSNYHGDYPFATSRDTTVGTFLGEVGIGPAFLGCTILTLTALPSRNAQGAGALNFELSPEVIQRSAKLLQYGGGSYEGGDASRRVALFDWEMVDRAVTANTPTAIAVTGLDRLEQVLREDENARRHYGDPECFLRQMEMRLRTPVVLEGWGPFVEDIRVRRRDLIEDMLY